MRLSDGLLPEFDREMTNTRRTLERVSDATLAWKPHPKSFAMGGLATHLANLPTWVVHALTGDSLDIAPVGQPPLRLPQAGSRQEILETFDRNVTAARAAIASASDSYLLAPWTLVAAGKPVFSLPRIAVLRSMVLNHLIHHRGQLTVYLRLNDIPVPGLYGASADEGGRA
jgi:uncharacterized damage-inducible protein DinB